MADDMVNNPAHYGGADDPYEVIKVAEAWGFDGDAYLFNVLKYIRRDKADELEDLKKARFYLERKIKRMEENHAVHAVALADKPEYYRTVEIMDGKSRLVTYEINAHLDWTLDALAGIAATIAGHNFTGSFGISVSPYSEMLDGTYPVSYLLEVYPPESYNYYLCAPRMSPREAADEHTRLSEEIENSPMFLESMEWGDGSRLTEVNPEEGDPPASWVYRPGGDVWALDSVSRLFKIGGTDFSARSLDNLLATFGPLRVTKGAYTGLVLHPDGSVGDGTE